MLRRKGTVQGRERRAEVFSVAGVKFRNLNSREGSLVLLWFGDTLCTLASIV